MIAKLPDTKTAATYLVFLGGLLYKKNIPAIIPLFVNGKFVSDFCEKENLFDNILDSIKSSNVSPVFLYRANARITLFHFTEEDINNNKSFRSS